MAAEWRYKALLIGNATFPEDPHGLIELLGPPNDVRRLREVLTAPVVGLHLDVDVEVLLDRPYGELRVRVADFFGQGRKGEQLLLYYSGHGRRTLDGDLCLCALDTLAQPEHKLLATSLDSRFLAEQMRKSKATAKVIILDCCHSGAFDQHFRGGDLPEGLRGEGQFGLYSTHVHLPSPDAPNDKAMSPFTTCLVDALGSGSLDRDDDGFVDVEDVYGYILRTLRSQYSSIPTRSLPGPTVGTVALACACGRGEPETEPEAESGLPPRPPMLIMPMGPPTLAPVPSQEPLFHMASGLVTNRQFAQFLAEEANAGWRPGQDNAIEQADNDYLRHWLGGIFPEGLSEHPVVNVSAFAAQAYVAWVAGRWRLNLRLPAESEWDTAARSDWVDTDFVAYAIEAQIVNFRDTDGALTAVGELPLNPYGIGDLLGNASDICLPRHDSRLGDGIMACGGAYWTPGHLLTDPLFLRADECRGDLGFRCVMPVVSAEGEADR